MKLLLAICLAIVAVSKAEGKVVCNLNMATYSKNGNELMIKDSSHQGNNGHMSDGSIVKTVYKVYI